MTIVVAVVGGTIISVIFGYLVAYWRDLLNNPRRMGQGPEWLKSFERFVRVKQGEIRQQDSSVRSQMNGMGTGLGRGSVKPDLLGVGLKELEEFYQKNHGQAEAQFFAQLSLGRAQLDEAAAERSKQFKQKWGQAISSDFFKERLIELVIEQVFIQNKAQGQGLNLKAIYELWESYSALTLWYDDIRAKRASLAQDIVKRLALAPQAALRGLDFFFLAKSGQSKDSLKKQYWQEQLKGQDHMGRRLTQMSPERRKQLLLSLAFPARYKVKTYPELLNDACSLIAELEQFFEQAQAQENGQKKAPPKSGKTTGPKDDFSILEMEPTDDMATIKKAFRKMAMKYHPDRLNLQKEDDQKRAHERYVELQKAYERLEARVGKKAA